MYDVIAIGDCGKDIFLQVAEDNVQFFCELKRDECQLCFQYADKIPVQSKHEALGGNAANVAVGFARMGQQTALYAHVGGDQTGGQVIAELTRSGVETKYMERDKSLATNYNTVINILGERTILAYHQQRQYRWPQHLPAAKAVYLTSMKDGFQVILKDLQSYQAKHQAKLIFQPGTFQIKLGPEPVQAILKLTTLLVMNKEEGIRYLNADPGIGIPDLMRELKQLGPQMVIVTDGQKGSFANDGQLQYHLPIIADLKRVEATGAGDAFAMGTTCALLEGLPLAQAMRVGQIQAGSVIQQIGAQAGLLKRSAVDKLLDQYPNLQPQVIT